MPQNLSGGRAKTRDLNIIQAIKPAGIPGSTYVRPPEPQRPTNLIAIADALGSVNSALDRWSSRASHEAEVEKKRQDEIELTLAQGMTRDQLRTKIDSIPQKDKVKRDAFMALDGIKAAEGWQVGITNEYEQWVQENPGGDILGWLQEKQAEGISQLGDPAAQAGFIKANEPALHNILVGHQKKLQEDISNGRVEATTSMLRQIITQNRGDVTGAIKLIQDSRYSTKLAGLSPEENDAAIFSTMQWAALEGNRELVEALARMPRGGKGPLIDDPQWLSKSFPLIEAAENRARELKLKENPLVKGALYAKASSGEATDEELEAGVASNVIDEGEAASLKATTERAKAALAEKHADEMAKIEASHNHDLAKRNHAAVTYELAKKAGGGDILLGKTMIPNKKGDDVEELTKEEQRKAVIDYHEERINEMSAEKAAKDGPEAAAKWAFDEHLKFYTKNRWVKDGWQDLFSGVQMALPGALASQGEVPDDVKAAGQIYKSLRAKAPGLLKAMVKDDKTLTFLEAYRVASLRQTEEQAWASAAKVAERDARGELRELSIKQQDIDVAIKKVDKSFWSGSGAEITLEMREQIQKTANHLYWAGIPADKALDEATTLVSSQFERINGHAVYTADPNTPADFSQRVPTMLGDLVKKHGTTNDIDAADDLFVSPVGGENDGGSWMVMRKDGMGPLLDERGAPVTITSQGIEAHRAAEAVAKEKAAIEKVRKDREALKNLPQGMGDLPGLEPPGSPNEKVTPSGSGLPMPFKGSELNDGKIKLEPAAFKSGQARSPYQVAKLFNGLNEKDHKAIISAFIKKSAGMNVNPAKTAWCAGFVNAVLGATGREGTGSLAARSFLNYGTPTDRPSQGDIAVFERGNDPTKGHVGFFDGFVVKGGQRYVRVLSGNQRNAVNTSLYPESLLLGFRKPPLAGKQLS